MSVLLLSFACGLLAAATRSAGAIIFSTLAFAFTLVAATVSLGFLSWFLVATIAGSILAFNAGLMTLVLGELVFATAKISPRR